MNPRELAARQIKVDKLVAYMTWLMRRTQPITNRQIEPSDVAAFIRKLNQAERDKACVECELRPASETTWARVIEHFEAPDPFAGLEANVYNLREKWDGAA